MALAIWGTGTGLGEIAKLRAKMRYMEQKLYGYPTDPDMPMPTAPAAPVHLPVQPAPLPAQPEELPAAPPAIPLPAAPAAPANRKAWLPAVIVGAAALVIILVLVLILILGGGDKTPSNTGTPAMPANSTAAEPSDAPAHMESTAEPIEPEGIGQEPSADAPSVSEIKMGEPIITEFVEMNFFEYGMMPDIQKSVTIDNVTRTTGPDPIDGQFYVLLAGSIINTSKAPLPVYDFYIGEFDIDGYTYEVTANDCDILTADGSPVSTIDPLMEYEIRIYAAIPEKLAAEHSSASFTFGFFDGFENEELSYNKAFSEDPIRLCPYQYKITF